MAKLVYVNLEACSANTDGDAFVLYFEGEPSKQDVVAGCDSEEADRLPLSGQAKEWGYDVVATPVSERAGLVRVEVPAG